MTPQLSTVAARAGEVANNPSPDASHVELRNGVIWMWMDGVFGPVTTHKAWTEWFWLASSPIPATQQRAQAIRAVLDQVMQ